MNPTKIRSAIRHYFYGLVSSCWNAAVQCVCVGFGAGAADVSGAADLRSVSLRQIGASVAGTVLLHAFLYFKANPLPEKLPPALDVSAPPFPNPPAS